MTTKVISIIDALENPDWKIEEWQIKFLLSERLLQDVRKIVKTSDWYEDPTLAAVWISRLQICFNSIQNFYRDFKTLPQKGDRLFDEDSGLLVLERSIDGNIMTITFTLCI